MGIQVITKAHMNRREADRILLHTWFSYTEHRFIEAVYPETDAEARRYMPQDLDVLAFYDTLRDQGQTIAQAFETTLDWIIAGKK
jgi:hypothetical protein